jgi:voltage-gated potassium channel Kch
VLARAKGRDHAYRLVREGVEYIFRETLGSSLDVANTTLRLLGVRAYEARRIISAFRKYDEEGVRELARYSDNLDELVSHTRKRIQTLEELFENERTRVRHADVGWEPPKPE